MAISPRTFPSGNLKLITPSANILNPPPRGLYIAAAGTISFTNQDTSTESNMPVFDGAILPFQPAKVTAATDAVVYGFFD
jgi:hypothetical protein